MTETGRPYGGVNKRPDDDEPLPGERPEPGRVGANPAEEPRAAQGGMSDDVTHVPDNDTEPGEAAKRPGIADATGPQG